MIPLLVILFVIVLQASPIHTAIAPHNAAKYLKYYNVKKSVDIAQKLLNRADVTDTADRLAVMLLYSHDITDSNYGPCLKCSLALYVENLLPRTDADLFLFIKEEYVQIIAGLPWVKDTPNLYIMILDENDDSSWRIPEWVRPEDVCPIN